MIETQLVFRNEYRFDLKSVNSVLIPYLFGNDDHQLIIVVKAQKNYKTAGTVEQVLLDLPNKPSANSQTLKFGEQLCNFPQLGKFKLQFYPNSYIGKTSIAISRLISNTGSIKDDITEVKEKVNEISDLLGG